MKSYDEMTQSVLERGDRYFRRKEKRIAAVKKGAPFMSLFGIFTLVGLGLFSSPANDAPTPDIPQQIEIVETQTEVQTETKMETVTETVSTASAESTGTTSSSTNLSSSAEVPNTALTSGSVHNSKLTASAYTIPDVIVKETAVSSSVITNMVTVVNTDTSTVTTVQSEVIRGDELDFDYMIKSDGTVEILPPIITRDSVSRYEKYDKLVIPSEIDGRKVTSIGECAFYKLKNLSEVSIPDTVTKIGVRAFCSCPALTDVIIPESVDIIEERAFCECPSLSDITFPENVTYEYIGEAAFINTAWLEARRAEDPLVILGNILIDGAKTNGDVVIPSGVTFICNYAFSLNDSITGVTIPAGTETISKGAFSLCSALRSAYIPSTVQNMGKDIFAECSALENITFEDGLRSIGENAFYKCVSLKNVYIPDSVTSISDTAFYRCSGLEKVRISENLTKLPSGIFCFCSSLTDAVIPDSVTSIEYAAFGMCDSLKEITVPKNVKYIGNEAFDSNPGLESIYILNPDCAIEDSDETISNGTVIYGYSGSTAESYAEKYDRTFVSIDENGPSSDTDAVYTGTLSSNISWKYNDRTRTMVFSGTGKMPDNVNTEVTPEWKNLDVPYRAVHVIFEEGITGADWFADYFCEPDLFGDETGSLTIADSVSIDKTFWQLLHSSGVYDKITFHGVYGSSFWSFAPIDRFVGESYSENPVANITGETSDGALWKYTYENAVLDIKGNGTANSTDFGLMPFEKSRFIVLGKELDLPESETDRTSLFMRYFAMGGMYRSNQEIFIYADSPAMLSFSETMAMLRADGEIDPESKYQYTVISYDVNGDGTVSCADASEILSVYSNLAALNTDKVPVRKQILCNVNGSDTVDLSDATSVLKAYAESAAGIR